MLYININETITIKKVEYSVNYIDCPDFTFVKRISKQELKNNIHVEKGIDFSETVYYFEQKLKDNGIPYDMQMIDIKDSYRQCKLLVTEFNELDVIAKIEARMNNDLEKLILHNLFKEIVKKVDKKT